METDISGKTLYLLRNYSEIIDLIRNENGTLSNLTNYNLGTNCYGNKMITDQYGRYLALSNHDSNNINIFKINQETGILYDNILFGCSNKPVEITFDPMSKYIYVTADNAAGSNIIRILHVNDNGVISEVNGSPIVYSGNKINFLKSVRK
jgi:DNA-binding beta-propeller fold protein YncE